MKHSKNTTIEKHCSVKLKKNKKLLNSYLNLVSTRRGDKKKKSENRPKRIMPSQS